MKKFIPKMSYQNPAEKGECESQEESKKGKKYFTVWQRWRA